MVLQSCTYACVVGAGIVVVCMQSGTSVYSLLSIISGSISDFACAGSQASTGQLSCFTGGEGLVFCSGSASVPRGVATPMYDLSTRGIVGGSCTASDLFEPIGDVQFCAHDGTEETFM